MIDGIDNTGITGPLQSQPVDPIQKKQQEALERQSSVDPQGASDSARISADAAEVSRYQEMIQLHREAYGNTERTEKLDEIRQKIEDGFYDDPDVMDAVAGAVASAITGGTEETNVERATRRSEEGFYDRPDVVDETASNMLKDVLPGSGEDGE